MQKIVRLAVVLGLFLGSNIPLVKAQGSLDQDIQAIVKTLIVRLNAKPSIKTVAVSDFTNLEGVPTKLGKYLAEEFQYSLAEGETNFMVINRSQLNLLLDEAGLDAQGLLRPGSSAKLGKIASIDAIIFGTLTPTTTTVKVNVQAVELNSTGIVGVARGELPRTPTINELEQASLGSTIPKGVDNQVVLPKQNPTETSKKNSDSSLKPLVWKKQDLNFELIDCQRNGRYLDCKVRIISKTDCSLTVYSQGTKATSTNGGFDYHPADLKLADNYGGNSVTKELTANTPIIALISFGNIPADINELSKLDLNCWVASIGGFVADWRDVSIR